MRIVFLSCLFFLLLACHKDKVEGLLEGEENCAVSFALNTDYTLNEVVLTRSVTQPSLEDLKVRIENTRAEVLKEWDYKDLPSIIKVVPGSYKLVGWYGNDTILPAFESTYYYGETKITLKEGDVLDTLVNVKVGAAKVSVDFDESFEFDYSDYFVDVKTVGDSLRFLKDETREGYFKPGKLRMRFGLKPKGEDVWYQFYPDPIGNIKAAEYYKMTLKAKSENGALKMISITTDSSTIDIPVDVDLPPFYLPKPAPQVNLAVDEMDAGSILTTEGLSKKAVAMITAGAGLTELKIRTTSDTLLHRGWPGEIDLMKATPEQKVLLKANGLAWSEEIDTKDTIKSSVWVSFNDVIKLLNTVPGEIATSAFEVVAKDQFQQAGNDCAFNVKVAPPVFEFVTTPGEGNVFAKRAMYDVKYASEARTPVVECQGADGKWIALETELKEKATDTYECIGKGLTPAADYAFRIRLGGHVLEAGNYTTEDVLQVPNAGMEDWYEAWTRDLLNGAVPFKTYKVSIFQPSPTASDAVWTTVNAKTGTGKKGTLGTGYSSYNVMPSTLPASERGGKVARLRTIGWEYGAGNSAVKCAHVSAGKLFLGEYTFNGDNLTEKYNYGCSFYARPNAVAGYYKYIPYGNDMCKMYVVVEHREGNEITRLGYGEIQKGETDYVSFRIPIEYTNTLLKATHICIFFSSSKYCSDSIGEEDSALNSETWRQNVSDEYTHWEGSNLYVDDIELIYE